MRALEWPSPAASRQLAGPTTAADWLGSLAGPPVAPGLGCSMTVPRLFDGLSVAPELFHDCSTAVPRLFHGLPWLLGCSATVPRLFHGPNVAPDLLNNFSTPAPRMFDGCPMACKPGLGGQTN